MSGLTRPAAAMLWTLLLWGFAAAALAAAAPPPLDSGPASPDMTAKSRFSDFLKWRWQHFFADIPGPESYHFPLAANDPAFLRANRTANTLTWIGHATLLLQIGGRNILTDPHFSRRASPVQWAGPQRVVAPGIAFDDLPAIDIVVISHDHYDSLDTQTVLRLAQRRAASRRGFLCRRG